MISIERTAYPVFKKTMSKEELQEYYRITSKEPDFIRCTAKGASPRLTLAVTLKIRQNLGHFPALYKVLDYIKRYIAKQLNLQSVGRFLKSNKRKKLFIIIVSQYEII